ncbi:hypothetical protein [Flavobacterium sp.]|uniref:nucleotidyl transferase AbiEii/AbiGii toxin family protein n=1 Tax=Flavobacterium sp. TaxID=239 RepID=UPI003265A178
MNNKIINIDVVGKVADGLKELREKVVFIGGAVISLYTDDPAADEIRPTTDIDMTIDIASYSELTAVQQRLLDLGFSPDHQGHSIITYFYNGIAVDIMPADDSAVGVSNQWYKPGFDNLEKIELENQLVIRIFTAPYFLATKFDAFKDRGNCDYPGSHDFEDIIYLLDNRTTIVQEILNADENVKTYLINEITQLLKHRQSHEILSMHIHPLVVDDRYPLLIEKLNAIIV